MLDKDWLFEGVFPDTDKDMSKYSISALKYYTKIDFLSHLLVCNCYINYE